MLLGALVIGASVALGRIVGSRGQSTHSSEEHLSELVNATQRLHKELAAGSESGPRVASFTTSEGLKVVYDIRRVEETVFEHVIQLSLPGKRMPYAATQVAALVIGRSLGINTDREQFNIARDTEPNGARSVWFKLTAEQQKHFDAKTLPTIKGGEATQLYLDALDSRFKR